MTQTRWHILKEDGALTLARRVPVRFDLKVDTRLDAARPLRIAHQVRQDMWRALRGMRGFAPAVRVEERAGGLHVSAGGQVDGALNRRRAEFLIAGVLECPRNRARWMRCAR